MKTPTLPTVTAAQVLITNAARAQVNGGKMSDEEVELALSYAKAEYPDLYEKMIAHFSDTTRFLKEPKPYQGSVTSRQEEG